MYGAGESLRSSYTQRRGFGSAVLWKNGGQHPCQSRIGAPQSGHVGASVTIDDVMGFTSLTTLTPHLS
jgi:hypothetical protein